MLALPSKYNNVQVALHWLVAVLVLFMLFMGNFFLAQTPNTDPMKITGLRAHMIAGVAIFVLILIRLVWRRMSVQPPHAETGNALLDKLGVAAHYAFNILALLVVASGIGIALQAGLPDIVLGGLGTLPEDFFLPTRREFPWHPDQAVSGSDSSPRRGSTVSSVLSQRSPVQTGLVREV